MMNLIPMLPVAPALVAPPQPPHPHERKKKPHKMGEITEIVPHDGVEWINASHDPTQTRLLTEDDPRAPTPPGFRGTLYPPQATLLHALISIARTPFIRIETDNKEKCLLQTDRVLIAEKFGFGKTVLVLAFVCAMKAGRAKGEGVARLPTAVNIPLMDEACHRDPNKKAMVFVRSTEQRTRRRRRPQEGSTFDVDKIEFMPEMTCHYKHTLDVTLVCAANSVITQWENNAKQFTPDLKYYTIENVNTLRAFEEEFRNGTASRYDMIFVKVGRVTSNFKIEGEEKVKTANRSLINAVAAVLEGHILTCKLVDDYDTIKLMADDNLIPALLTIPITATRRTTTARLPAIQFAPTPLTPADFLRQNIGTFPILAASQDNVLYGPLSLHCDPAYVEKFITTKKMHGRNVYVRGGRMAALLRDLGVKDEIVEMVNADAIGTAAEALGINAKSTRDIIDRVLSDRRDKYKRATLVIARVKAARDHIAAKDGEENDNEFVKKFRATLKDGTEDEVKKVLNRVRGPSPTIAASLDSLMEWAEAERDEVGKTLQRMRDNIREQQCQCCMIPLSPDEDETKETKRETKTRGEDAYVLNCCQIIVCEPCITVAQQDYGRSGDEKTRKFITKCPSCIAPLRAGRDLIRVGKDLSLEDALSDDIVVAAAKEEEAAREAKAARDVEANSKKDDIKPEKKVETPTDEVKKEQFEKKLAALNNPRLKALVQILHGVPLEEVDCLKVTEFVPDAKGLLSGKDDTPPPPTKPLKIMIATMHAESTRLISATLENFGLKFQVLHGTKAQKNKTVETFKREGPNGINIMIVTSSRDSSGLHLPEADVLIEYHYITSADIRSQTEGRLHRPGRKYSSKCIRLLNETEAAAE